MAVPDCSRRAAGSAQLDGPLQPATVELRRLPRAEISAYTDGGDHHHRGRPEPPLLVDRRLFRLERGGEVRGLAGAHGELAVIVGEARFLYGNLIGAGRPLDIDGRGADVFSVDAH